MLVSPHHYFSLTLFLKKEEEKKKKAHKLERNGVKKPGRVRGKSGGDRGGRQDTSRGRVAQKNTGRTTKRNELEVL